MTIEIKTWQDFALHLIWSKEIDPSYNMLVGLRKEKGDDWVKRFCVAYLLFYHTGVAAAAAECEGEDFWIHLSGAYGRSNTRGSERRHFRGSKGRDALNWMIETWAERPEEMFDYPRDAASYEEFFRKIAGKVPQFGQYFIWKWHDFTYCVFGDNRYVNDATLFLPDVPVSALKAFWPTRNWRESLYAIEQVIMGEPDPFLGVRPCGICEAETIACSLKSYVLKHPSVWIGFDIREKHAQLPSDSPLRQFLPPIIEPSRYKVDRYAVLDSAQLPA